MLKRGLLLIGMGIGFLFFIGCARTTLVEMDYGTSFDLAKQNQILNPEGMNNLEPVTGFDGKAAQKTMEKYRKDFERPAPPPTYVLGLGSTVK
jgi:hypothetical protein